MKIRSAGKKIPQKDKKKYPAFRKIMSLETQQLHTWPSLCNIIGEEGFKFLGSLLK